MYSNRHLETYFINNLVIKQLNNHQSFLKMSAKNQTKIFKIIGLLLILFQLLFDTINVLQFSEETKMIIGASAMFIAVANAGFKQYLDNNISNYTLIVQVLLFISFVCGGVMEHFNQLDFLGEETTALIRVCLTFTTTAIPIIIKTIDEE